MVLASDSTFDIPIIKSELKLNPQFIQHFSDKYVVGSLFRGYFTFDDQKGLQADLAKNCVWKTKLKLECQVRLGKYQSGQAMALADFRSAFVRLFKEKESLRTATNFLSLKNASKILTGKLSADNIGVSIKKPNKVIFHLDQMDGDFKYRLIHPAVTPRPFLATSEDQLKKYSTGPYFLASSSKSSPYLLKQNPHYWQRASRPAVRFVTVDDDVTALNLYKKKQLDLTRYVPTVLFPQYQKDPEFYLKSVQRFDFIGFSDHLKAENTKSMRKALVHSVNYADFKKIFKSLGQPGCFGLIGDKFKDLPCLKTDLKKVTKQKHDKALRFYVIQQYASDIVKIAQWYQAQWKSKLKLNIQIYQEEYLSMMARLRSKPPDIFRKGIPMDRPTCLNGLEIFYSKSSDNWIDFKDKKYDQIVDQLKNPFLKTQTKHWLCKKAMSRLLNSYLLIPQGAIHFGMLVSGKYSGWKLNSLNQLDLAGLRVNNTAH